MNIDSTSFESSMIIDQDTYDLTVFNTDFSTKQSYKLNRCFEQSDDYMPNKRMRLEDDCDETSNCDFDSEDLDNDTDNESIRTNCFKTNHNCLNDSQISDIDLGDSADTKNYQQIAYRNLRNALAEKSFCLSPFRSTSSSSSSSSTSRSSSLSVSPKLTDQLLIKSLEVIDLRDNDLLENFENLLTRRPINKMFKYSFNQLNLHRKETFIYLIERNMSNKILSPFDQYAYLKLKNGKLLNTNLISDQTKYDFNYCNIKKISKLMRTLNVREKSFLKQNNLMPNCISSLLMPFFFDIFTMSELKLFGDETVNIMLNLKQTYKAQVYLDEQTLTSYLTENIVWNCLALFKLKLKDLSDDQTLRMGYFNYYLTYIYIRMHLDYLLSGIRTDSCKDLLKRSIELGFVLPHLLDALILTGLFKHCDYVKFKKFFQEKKKRVQCIENVYLENAMNNVSQTADICFPLKLKNLCRIQIKKSLVNYSVDSLNQLAIPNSTKRFLMYNDELELIYTKKSRL